MSKVPQEVTVYVCDECGWYESDPGDEPHHPHGEEPFPMYCRGELRAAEYIAVSDATRQALLLRHEWAREHLRSKPITDDDSDDRILLRNWLTRYLLDTAKLAGVSERTVRSGS